MSQLDSYPTSKRNYANGVDTRHITNAIAANINKNFIINNISATIFTETSLKKFRNSKLSFNGKPV